MPDEELPRFVGLLEAARLADLSVNRMLVLVERDDFPKPVGRYSRGKLWRVEDIERWAAERRQKWPKAPRDQ